MTDLKPVDIVIVNHNTRDYLRACLRSLERQTDGLTGVSVFVADNRSEDGSVEMVMAEFPDVNVIALSENIGFGAANNRAIAAGSAPYILCLNSDAELTEGALEGLLAFMDAHPSYAIVGPRLVRSDGSYHPSCRRFPTLLRNIWMYTGLEARWPNRFTALHNWLGENEHTHGRIVDFVSGACFMVRRKDFEEVDGFDENFFLYEEETDLSMAVRELGREIAFCDGPPVIHHGGASTSSDALSEFIWRQIFRSKYVLFRKRRGTAYATLVHLSDLGVFGSRLLRRRFFGDPKELRVIWKACRAAWQESFIPLENLLSSPQFPDV